MTARKRWVPKYPLGEEEPERIRSGTGLALDEVTLEAIRASRLRAEDFTIHADTLRMQAEIASAAGYGQLAANLVRAAELVDVPNDRLLEIYEALRPNRATYQELLDLGKSLETHYGAKENARFIYQAADAYRTAGLLRSEPE